MDFIITVWATKKHVQCSLPHNSFTRLENGGLSAPDGVGDFIGDLMERGS